MSGFEQTMGNSRIFLTYSLAFTMLGKCVQILAERGADPLAINFITTGIELLTQQLRDYAKNKERDKELEEELNRICKIFDIRRAPEGN